MGTPILDTQPSETRERGFCCLQATQSAGFCHNSLNRLGQSPSPGNYPNHAPSTLPPLLLFPFLLLGFLSPPQGLSPSLGLHLWVGWGDLGSSPYFSSPVSLLLLLPFSLLLGTPGSNISEHSACSLMISSPGNLAKHKTDTDAPPHPNPTAATHSCAQGRLQGRPAAAHLLSPPPFPE